MQISSYLPLSIKDHLVARYAVEFFAPFEVLERFENCFSLDVSVTIEKHRCASHILLVQAAAILGVGFPLPSMRCHGG